MSTKHCKWAIFEGYLMLAVCEPTPVFGVKHGKHVNHRGLKKLQMTAIYPLHLLMAGILMLHFPVVEKGSLY